MRCRDGAPIARMGAFSASIREAHGEHQSAYGAICVKPSIWAARSLGDKRLAQRRLGGERRRKRQVSDGDRLPSKEPVAGEKEPIASPSVKLRRGKT